MAKKRSPKKEETPKEEKAVRTSAKKKTTKAKEEKVKTKSAPEIPELSDELVDEIYEKIDEFKSELEKSTRFAAAAKRARKATTELQDIFKKFRKASVEYWKKD